LIDAEFALNEGGYGELAGGRRVANDIQASEKYMVNFRLEVRNKGGHSSLPTPDNAIYHLAGALDRLGKFAFPPKLNDVTRAFFTAIAKVETGPRKADLARVAEGDAAAMARVSAASATWNATLRTTCVATQVEAGHARNALPQLAAANVNCRILPDESIESVTAALKKVIADDQVSLTLTTEPDAGRSSAMREDILKPMARITDTMWPSVPVIPVMVPYATDGRFLRKAGIPTYGLQGIFQDRDDIRWHGRDERILVQSFNDGEKFLYDLVKLLAAKAN
jgi:acetylornithine deacetylase/succinyl-diaminopimelate desuccinylase-like protein